MKQVFIGGGILGLLFISCSKIEEKVNSTVTSTQEKVQQKTEELVQNAVTDQLGKLVDAEALSFDSVFPHSQPDLVQEDSGKKVVFPNGAPFYFFKYKTSDKDALLKMLYEQETTDEAQSMKTFEKVDGALFIEKLSFFEKFLPADAFGGAVIEELKNNPTAEYYKVKRFPHSSTIIYNPKNGTVYQFVDVKKH